jgi:hypothetical protein
MQQCQLRKCSAAPITQRARLHQAGRVGLQVAVGEHDALGPPRGACAIGSAHSEEAPDVLMGLESAA